MLYQDINARKKAIQEKIKTYNAEIRAKRIQLNLKKIGQ